MVQFVKVMYVIVWLFITIAHFNFRPIQSNTFHPFLIDESRLFLPSHSRHHDYRR